MLKFNRIITKNRGVCVFIVLGLFTAGFCARPSTASESLAEATKNLPPNAYCYYVKALEMRRQAALANSTSPPSPPDEEHPLRQAAEPDYKQSPAEINADAETLEIVRQGFAFKYRSLQSSTESFGGDRISFNSSMSTIATLFAKESDAKAAKGDWGGAANSALDGIRLGQDISHGSIADMLIGRSIQAIASKNLHNLLDHSDAKTAKNVIARLTKILSQKIEYADVLQTEKQTGLWVFKELATSSDWRKEAHVTSAKSLPELKNEYVSTMDELAANARLPYPWRKTSIPTPDEPLNQTTLGLFSNPKYLLHGMTQGTPLAIQQTKSTFMLVEFALRAYRLEHHKYPSTLAELTPDYLQEIPEDPFSSHQPLRYKTVGKTYILYSIGPDGKDDGGKQIDGKRVYANSKGDIVSGAWN